MVGAANCSDVTSRLDKEAMIEQRLPILRQAVRRIEGTLVQHPELAHSVESVGADYARTPVIARVGSSAREVRTNHRASRR